MYAQMDSGKIFDFDHLGVTWAIFGRKNGQFVDLNYVSIQEKVYLPGKRLL